MTTHDNQREGKSVSDVRPKGKKSFFHRHNILDLKPVFRLRHPWVWTAVFLGIVAVLFLGIRQFSTKADVQDFSPTTCLGNWQNVSNAEGSPETVVSPGTPFSEENSAVYASGTQIYCGGFVPPSFATSGQITNVGLTLVWQIGDIPTSSPATESSTASSANATTTSDTSSTVTTTSATVDQVAPSSTIVASSSEDDPSDSNDDATTTDVVPIPVVTSTPVPTPAPVLDSGSPSTTDASDTSFIRQLIPFALADDAADVGSGTSSTVIASGTSATTITTSTVTLPAPAPDDNFLDVSYSTDGQTWTSIGQVNMQNWQQFTVTLPVSDWTDLQNLQIRVEGIPTTQDPIPPVYLDGMFMEVHYDVASPLSLSDIATSTDEATSSATPSSSRMTLVDPGAEQDCDVHPFSQLLPLGGSAMFVVNLQPSINGVSYNLFLGHLPLGVSANFGTPSGAIAATSSLTLQADTSTIPGSMNIAVIYQEHEEDGTTLSNFCQLNIDVK